MLIFLWRRLSMLFVEFTVWNVVAITTIMHNVLAMLSLLCILCAVYVV